MTWFIKVLDSATFDLIFKVNENHTQVYNLSTQTMAFYSSDYKKLAFVAWRDNERNPELTTHVFVMTLSTGGTCLSLMTLKEICRATILKFPTVRRMAYESLPETLTDFISGL